MHLSEEGEPVCKDVPLTKLDPFAVFVHVLCIHNIRISGLEGKMELPCNWARKIRWG